jgi:hypothetical protein
MEYDKTEGLMMDTINRRQRDTIVFEDAHYRWSDGPVDGEYELQFDRFETSSGGDRYDKAILLIAEKETTGTVGDVTLQTAEVPALDPDKPNMTRIFHSIIENGEIVDMNYDPELSEQRHEEINELHERVRAASDDENDIEK